MEIIKNLVDEIQKNNYSIGDVLRLQLKYHESRRWSVYELIGDRTLEDIEDRDRAALYHAAKAEITTQPAGIRLATDGLKLAKSLEKINPLGAKIAHIAAAWSARFWLEEEAHHEVAYAILLEMSGVDPIENNEIVEHRGAFPEDNYARVCVLQACVEIESSMTYGSMARTTKSPLVREVFSNIMRDEVQHRQYFVSFAKALVDANVYPTKDILAMALTWIRPGAGETHGSIREKQTKRDGFVNWWENVRTDESDYLSPEDAQIRSDMMLYKKIRSVLALVYDITGIKVESVEELQKAYYESLKAKNTDSDRLAIHS